MIFGIRDRSKRFQLNSAETQHCVLKGWSFLNNPLHGWIVIVVVKLARQLRLPELQSFPLK